ncbi:hypothetical protein Dimus_007263 [Dionaea muscipula]
MLCRLITVTVIKSCIPQGFAFLHSSKRVRMIHIAVEEGMKAAIIVSTSEIYCPLSEHCRFKSCGRNKDQMQTDEDDKMHCIGMYGHRHTLTFTSCVLFLHIQDHFAKGKPQEQHPSGSISSPIYINGMGLEITENLRKNRMRERLVMHQHNSHSQSEETASSGYSKFVSDYESVPGYEKKEDRQG